MTQLKIAIVGSGPSAFYAAQALFKANDTICVDMFEKLPTPFGLLRAGVAPDHQQMKTISKSYEKIAENPNFRFFGNVVIGDDLTIDTLKEYYHSVIIAIGAETDRSMGILGEDAKGSHTATEFVAWYNGHPDYQDKSFNLDADTAVVIGQGNVAVDVTRILAKSESDLGSTDIASSALEKLSLSHIQNIYMVGRRGPAQAAFTQLELKELGNIDHVNVVIHDDLNLSESDTSEMDNSAKVRKNIELLNDMKSRDWDSNPKKTIHIMFYSSPVEILTNSGNVSGVKFETTELSGEAGKQKASGTGVYHEVPCSLVFRSIGYRGVEFPGLPFDSKRAIIPNDAGQVVDNDGTTVDQMFVTGWIKRGPSGVIGTNRADSIETVGTCLESLGSDQLDIELDIQSVLERKGIKFISYSDWKIIDQMEISEGEKKGKPREKFTSVHDILTILGK